MPNMSRAEQRRDYLSRQPIWPTKAPGMPAVGADFIAECESRVDDESAIQGTGKNYKEEHSELLIEVLREALYGQGELEMNFTVRPNKKESFFVVPGHIWSWDPNGGSGGPMPADVMVLGKNLGEQEVNRKRTNIGKAGGFLLHTLRKLGVRGIGDWYMTNILKTEHLDGERGALKAHWVKNQLHLLHQELRLVLPKYIICLGADAIKALLGKSMTLGKMEGRVVELEIPIGQTADDESTHKILVMACPHPAAVRSTPEMTDKFERALGRFHQLTKGQRWDLAEPDLDHSVVRTEAELSRVLHEAERTCNTRYGKIIGLDAEWHGEHPENEGAYMRTIQISWAHKKATTIVVNEAGGKKPGFKRYLRDDQGNIKYRHFTKNGKRRRKACLTTNGATDVLVRMLRDFLSDKRLAMHQGNADQEWLQDLGLDLIEQWRTPEDFEDVIYEGPLDTALMAHSVNETGDFTLTGQSVRYTEAPRYDIELYKWRDAYCGAHGLKSSQLEGFGDCPDEVLYSYAAYDADVTRRLALTHLENMQCDQFGNDCREAYWMSMQAALSCLEINRTGILLDKDRVDEMTDLYLEAKQLLGDKIRQWAKWPELTLASRFQVGELLFGEKYNGHPKQQDGTWRRLRPKGARTVGAMPLLSTGKRPTPWNEIAASKKEEDYTPSTNKQVLGMLVHSSKNLRCYCKTKKHPEGKWIVRDRSDIIGWVRDYRFTSQVLQSVLRPPETDEESQLLEDEDGNWVYAKGIAGSMCTDGRVRTFISQLKETGRWASSRPPLQNISKRRESDYKRILKSLGLKYKAPLRSIFKADENYVLVEADYTGAELFGMALMSGDRQMIDHARRNLLPDDDPNFYDMHSNVAVHSFKLKCSPTKEGLTDIGKKHLRVVAKSVVFGVAYGRGAKAIAVAAKEEGVEITEAEAQAVIDAIFEMYPGLVDFFEECRSRAVTQREAEELSPRWLCNPFGRFRRFPITDDFKVAGDLERQAQNFPIQSMIADVVSLAIHNIYMARKDSGLDYKIVLQIHDAIVLLVHKDYVNEVCGNLLPKCMEEMVEIYRCTLDGEPDENSPTYHLGIGLECNTHWGVTMMPDECMDFGFDPKHTGWRRHEEVEGGWVNPESFGGKVWMEDDKQFHDVEELVEA